ncbi:MAG: lspA, partial [Noviherbaspirillum sp.]|nr:lspA [Noviherbaspirillum sp.]
MANNKRRFSSASSPNLTPWLGIAAIVILFDQITKITITKLFAYGESLAVTSFFNLVLVYNKGAAFSFLAAESGWQRYFFTAIAIAAVVF